MAIAGLPKAVGAKGRPLAGDALVREGQHLLAEPRPVIVDNAPLHGVTFSPDGTLLAIGGPVGQVTLRDAATGAKKGVLSVDPKHRVTRVRFSPDGRFLAASVFLGEQIHVWEVKTGKRSCTLKVQTETGFAFTPDGNHLVTLDRSTGAVQVWDVNKGALERELSEKGPRSSPFLEVSPDGKWLAIPQKGGKGVAILDLPTGKVRHRLDDGKGEVETVAFSPDGKSLAVSGSSSSPRLALYDVQTGKPRWQVKQDFSQWCLVLAFSPSGRSLAGGNNFHVNLFDARTGALALRVTRELSVLSSLAYSPDGKLLAAVDSFKRRIHFWEIVPSEQEKTLTAGATPWDIAAGPSGKLLAVATGQGIEVHDMTSGKRVRTLGAKHGWSRVAFDPDEKSVLGLGAFNEALFDLATGKEQPVANVPDGAFAVYSPDGKLVLAGSGGISVHKGGKELRHIDAPRAKALALSADGKLAAVGDARGKVHLWEVETGKPRAVLDAHEGDVGALAFSPDGQRLASSGTHLADRTVRVWEIASGKEIATLKGHASRVTGLVIARDGKHLVSGGRDGRLLVWDLAKGRLQRSLRAHLREVTGLVALGPGRFLSAEGEPRRLLVWDWAKVTGPGPSAQLPVLEDSPPPAFLTRLRSLGSSPRGAGRTTISPDERWLAWGKGKDIHVRDLKAGKDRFVLKGHAHELPGPFLFSADGKYLVSQGRETIRWGSLQTGKQTKRWKVEDLRGLTWADGGKTLVSLASHFISREVSFWDAATGKVVRKVEGEKIPVPNGPFHVGVSPDGRLLALVSLKEVLLLDAHTFAVVHRLEPELVGPALAFSPDSKLLAVGGEDTFREAPISVYEVASGRLLHTLRGYRRLDMVAFTRGGKELTAYGWMDEGETDLRKCLRLWDVKTGTERVRLTWSGEGIISPDGKRLLTHTEQEGIKVWNLEDVHDADLQEALGPLGTLGAEGELRDGKLWVTLKVQGRLSREALSRLAKSPRVYGLKLTEVEDDDLARLAKARSVKGLDLSEGSSLGDRAAKHLRRMTWLESLTLSRFALNDEALQQLKKALPKTKVLTAK
jgi:WD40 repeat protein